MAALSTIIGAAGLATAAVGAVTNFTSSQEASEQSQRAEGIRKRAAALKEQRERRRLTREAQQARANALVQGTAATGSTEGSGLQGGLSSIQTKGANNLGGLRQSAQIGQDLFDVNAAITDARSQASIGSGLQNLGFSVAGNASDIGRFFQTDPNQPQQNPNSSFNLFQ